MSPPSLGVFSTDSGGKDLKEKVSLAIKQVEGQRRELEQLRQRLEERRGGMFDGAVKAILKKDEMRARVLAAEHLELQKITRVVNAAEIALLQISVRMETIRDVGDVMFVLSGAFKTVRRIGKQISEVAPNLESSANEINESLSNILSELGLITPTIRIGIEDAAGDIFEKAQQLISERTSEILELPKTMEQFATSAGGEKLSSFEKTKRIALLATEGEEDGESLDESEFRPVLLSGFDEVGLDPERQVSNYAKSVGVENMKVADASATLNLPVDLVEQAYIKILRDSKFREKPHYEQPHSSDTATSTQ